MGGIRYKIRSVITTGVLVLMAAAAHAETVRVPRVVEMGDTALGWVIALILVVFVGTLLVVMMQLSASSNWSLADALSEETEVTETKDNLTKNVTKMMASSSRLIALLGLMGILALFIGNGITLIWQLAKGGDVARNAEAYSTYLMYGVVMFAPYAVNKFASIFERFGPPKGS